MSHKRGSILLITLWLIVVLSTLAIAVARQVSLELRVVNYRIAHAQARALAQGGVRLASALLERDLGQNKFDALSDEWATIPARQAPGYPAADATAPTLTVEVVDEDRYLSLNSLEEQELREQLHLPGEVAKAIVNDRDIRDATEDRLHDTPPYHARNQPFTCEEELADIPDVTPEVLKTVRLAASPFLVAATKVNLNTASDDALLGLGFTRAGVEALKDIRKRPGKVFKKEQDIAALAGEPVLNDNDNRNALGSKRLGVTSDVFRVKATGQLPRSSTTYVIQAIVTRAPQAGAATSSTAPTLIGWREG